VQRLARAKTAAIQLRSLDEAIKSVPSLPLKKTADGRYPMVIREKAGKEERSPSRRRRAPGPAIPGIDPIKSDDSHLYLPVFATLIILGDRRRVRF